MTGFARIRKTVAVGEIVLSVKSVNHRALDLHFHLPPELDPFEAALRKTIKGRVARGHLQIHVSFTQSVEASSAALNKPLLATYLSAFAQAVEEFGVTGKPDLNTALRMPGMIRSDATPELKPEIERTLVALMEEAVDILNRFREREGAVVAEEMRSRCAIICEQVSKMEKIRSRATAAFQKRLKERLRELLRGAAIEPQRLAQEAALLADRSDVSEELIRLKTHTGQVDALLQDDGEVGKKLDFLLQEMNREANTILSKTGGLGELGLTITELALASKSEIDKIREQSLNLE
jgi:uncharacterized protein (TIGR00255 family)